MPSNGLPALRPEHVPMERRSSMDPRHKATNAMSLSFIIEQDDSALANATGNSAPSSSKEPKEMSPARQEVTMFSGSLLELWKQFFSMHKTISTLQAELKVIRYQLAEIGKQKTETVGLL